MLRSRWTYQAPRMGALLIILLRTAAKWSPKKLTRLVSALKTDRDSLRIKSAYKTTEYRRGSYTWSLLWMFTLTEVDATMMWRGLQNISLHGHLWPSFSADAWDLQQLAQDQSALLVRLTVRRRMWLHLINPPSSGSMVLACEFQALTELDEVARVFMRGAEGCLRGVICDLCAVIRLP